jgi:hypothetical protein
LARYHLEDPFLRFWQRFVGPRQAELEIGHGQVALWHEIRHQLPQVVAPMWERVARWHLLRSGGRDGLPPVSEVGSWWSGQAQIDLVCVDRHSRSVILGEARWRQERVTCDSKGKFLLSTHERRPESTTLHAFDFVLQAPMAAGGERVVPQGRTCLRHGTGPGNRGSKGTAARFAMS